MTNREFENRIPEKKRPYLFFPSQEDLLRNGSGEDIFQIMTAINGFPQYFFGIMYDLQVYQNQEFINKLANHYASNTDVQNLDSFRQTLNDLTFNFIPEADIKSYIEHLRRLGFNGCQDNRNLAKLSSAEMGWVCSRSAQQDMINQFKSKLSKLKHVKFPQKHQLRYLNYDTSKRHKKSGLTNHVNLFLTKFYIDTGIGIRLYDQDCKDYLGICFLIDNDNDKLLVYSFSGYKFYIFKSKISAYDRCTNIALRKGYV